MRDVLIGIDAGTSVIKSVAFDASGRQIACTALPNRYDTFAGGGAEQDPARTWADTATTLRQLADLVPNLAERVAAIAVTAQGDGTWLIDADGEPVGKGWLWLDARSATIVEELRSRPEDRARFGRTASGLAACQQGPQLRWMKRHAPEAVARATTAFHCKDWLYLKLTGERATDPSEATFSFGDFRTRDYSDEVIEILDLKGERRLMPPIVDGTRQYHTLTDAAAGLTGLKAGTPVVLAYVDVACTALGAGIYDPGTVPGCTVLGSTGMHMRMVAGAGDVHLNDGLTGYTMTMPIPGVYAQMQSNMAATLNIDWILSIAGDVLATQGISRSRGEMLTLVDNWIASTAPGSLLYQPYVSEAGERGPFVDATARAGFVGLSMRHGFGDLVRAVFESLAFAARDCYTAMGDLPGEVRLTGGAAKSPALRKILGAALGADIRTSAREEAGAAGAAMIAAVCLGQYASMQDCAAEWVAPLLTAPEAPDQELRHVYDRAFPAYVQAHKALRPVWRSMAASRED